MFLLVHHAWSDSYWFIWQSISTERMDRANKAPGYRDPTNRKTFETRALWKPSSSPKKRSLSQTVFLGGDSKLASNICPSFHPASSQFQHQFHQSTMISQIHPFSIGFPNQKPAIHSSHGTNAQTHPQQGQGGALALQGQIPQALAADHRILGRTKTRRRAFLWLVDQPEKRLFFRE